MKILILFTAILSAAVFVSGQRGENQFGKTC